MLCRTTADCSWLAKDLLCQKYKLTPSPSQAWFKGASASIVGKCQCGAGKVWNTDILECQKQSLSGGGGTGGMIVLYCFVGLIVLGILCAVCYYVGSKT